MIVKTGCETDGSFYSTKEEAGWCEYVAAKYMILETAKVVAEACVLRDLVHSAFIPRLVAVYGGPLHNVLVTEFLAGGDLVTRTANTEYKLNERKCQIFIRQVHLLLCYYQFSPSQNIINSVRWRTGLFADSARCAVHPQPEDPPPRPEALQHHVLQPR